MTGRISLFQKYGFDPPEILHRFKLDTFVRQHPAGKIEMADFDRDMRLGQLMVFEYLDPSGSG